MYLGAKGLKSLAHLPMVRRVLSPPPHLLGRVACKLVAPSLSLLHLLLSSAGVFLPPFDIQLEPVGSAPRHAWREPRLEVGDRRHPELLQFGDELLFERR